MGHFEDEIAKALILALFVPLIISSGGNSGSQASTLIIQAMAVGEIYISDWWRVLKREIISGILLGSVLGLLGFC
jgi:magnesium transporter